MEKVLLYGTTAILLGIIMMGLPFMLVHLDPSHPISRSWFSGETSTKSATTQDGTSDGQQAVEAIMSPATISSIGLLVVPSFLLAVGISFCVKKKMR